MVIRRGGSERVVPAADFFIGPGTDITRITVLRPDDLLTSIRIPATFAGKQFYFEKVRDRQVWDFPLVNVASALAMSGSTIGDARIVVNAVSARPMRLQNVEAFVRGKARDEATAEAAGEMAVQGAVPLTHNAYKIPLMKALVKRAIRGAGPAWTS
jgi:xanthine dehydrogenase YagS FAD-binding subunit